MLWCMTWLVFACSGPGAMAVIESNERWGWRWFYIAAAVAALAIGFALVKKRASKWIVVTLVALAVHPSVWMGARGGDCGSMLYFAWVAGSVLVVVFALLTARGRRETLEPAA